MTQVVLFLIILFGVTWPWGYLARPLFVSGDLWTFLAGVLPSVWAPTIIPLMFTGWAEGDSWSSKRIQGAAELLSWIGSMAHPCGQCPDTRIRRGDRWLTSTFDVLTGTDTSATTIA
jgi:hypothetical protein